MPGASKKIVIFDDDEEILFISTYVLEQKGWEVHAFPDCNNIIDKIKAINPDIILMDNWIPQTGGVEATRSLKNSELKNIPVIYFSANSDIAMLAKEAGAESYIAKPFDLEEFERVINNFVPSKEE